jgi:hypothetical protein
MQLQDPRPSRRATRPSGARGRALGLKAGGLPGQTDGLPLGNRVQRLGLCGTRWRLKVTLLKVEAVWILPKSWSCSLYPYTGTLWLAIMTSEYHCKR